MTQKAVFLDRDGVIVRDHGYTHKIKDLEFLPGVIDALKRLRASGYRLIVVTNQSGVARGFFSVDDVERFHAHMQDRLMECGARIDDFFVCPHHPDGAVKKFAIACACRKPGIALISAAVEKHGIDLAQSYLVGDKFSDIECGTAAGVASILVRSHETKPHPSAIAEVQSLADACKIIIP